MRRVVCDTSVAFRASSRHWSERQWRWPHEDVEKENSGNVPSDLTKGTGIDLSAMIFGAWADLLIGQWGGIDLIVDDVTEAAKGDVRLVAHSEWDIAVRHAESFAAI